MDINMRTMRKEPTIKDHLLTSVLSGLILFFFYSMILKTAKHD